MNLMCLLGRHKFRVIRKISNNIQEIKCNKCGKEFGINHDLEAVLPLDEELKNAHDFILGVVYK